MNAPQDRGERERGAMADGSGRKSSMGLTTRHNLTSDPLPTQGDPGLPR